MTELMTIASPQPMRSEPAIAPEPASPPGETPPSESFAEALVTAGHGPPGSDAKADTRTAVAEGAKAESDSPGLQDGQGPAAPVAATDATLALVASMVVANPDQPPAADAAPSGEAAAAHAGGGAAQTVAAPPAVAGSAGPAVQPVEQPVGPGGARADDAPIAGNARETATSLAQQPATAAAPVAEPPAAASTASLVRPGAPGADPAAPQAARATAQPAATAQLAAAASAEAATTQPVVDAAGVQDPPPAPATGAQMPQPTAPRLPDDGQAVQSPTVVPPVMPRVETPAATSPVAPAPPPPPPPAAPVPLHELAHAAGVAIRFTAGQSGGTARILLHPQELGSVEIRLRYTTDGISATLRADSPQAAQTLTLASDELRRSLEAQGLPVLNLDVSDGSRKQAAHDDPESSARRRLDADQGAEESEPLAGGPVRRPEAGSQIDVLA